MGMNEINNLNFGLVRTMPVSTCFDYKGRGKSRPFLFEPPSLRARRRPVQDAALIRSDKYAIMIVSGYADDRNTREVEGSGLRGRS